MKLYVRGTSNRIRLGKNLLTWNLILVVDGSQNVVEIGDSFSGGGRLMISGNHNRLLFGANIHLNASRLFLIGMGCRLILGTGCVLSEGVDIRTTDSHFINDQATDRQINPDADVVLGDRVWLGRNVSVLKGSRIGSDSVVGTGAVVAGEIPANVVAGGVPARVIREGVYWVK
uniref:Acetyltransferase (Isoleucine patch superfamily) n=1 Tax=Candidatus Kentrum sp. LPFa TaxID=2126335 RepID=A0A450WS26_9GAMM|nr:MAG: Acetyltransferase (isoleucine patch superfamily) [Candidatus Kentron sp. LPFa]